MYNGKSLLAIIPARGGSKGIPRKNITNMAGKPLIAWTIEEAKKSKYLDRLILSSEDDEIIAVANKWGCEVPFRRPLQLALDDTPGIEPVLHAINTLPEKYDYVVLLQVTSPLRTVIDIDGCIDLCVKKGAESCVSVVETDHGPYWMYFMGDDQIIKPVMPDKTNFIRRQDLPKTFVLNGAVYVADIDWLKENRSFCTLQTIGYIMPKERSIDIDTKIDLEFADFLIGKSIVNEN